ncbi:MAG: hypothetical protein M3016_08790 [Actinomycetota bacterium]|nr:hypothetical protein [Actinomycetota bacterium]
MPTSPTLEKITFTGAIGDYGKATSQTKSGKTTPNGNYEKIVLQKAASSPTPPGSTRP